MAGYAPLTRPTKTKTPVGRVKTRQTLLDFADRIRLIMR